jgi:outer membrane protein OmpA-like peptidoglycan-associated protein
MNTALEATPFAVPGEHAPAWSAALLGAIGVVGFAWSGVHLVDARHPTTVVVGAETAVVGAEAVDGAGHRAAPTRVAVEAVDGPTASALGAPPTATPSAPEPVDCPPLFSVRFGRTSSDAIDLDAPAIAALVTWLRRHPDSALVIQGHADAVGKARFNFALSHRRARAVARRFAEAGLPKRRMVVQAVGEFQPRVDGDLADNRRVVLRATRAEGCRGAFTPEDDR